MLRRFTVARPEDTGTWSQGALDPRAIREALCEIKQERYIDAEAIAEAATRPTMRFVAVKEADQVDLQALHRIRDQMVGSRTRLINQMRAF
ncbi:transposase [Bradyrhizobium ottawaense]|uniref:IS110 family transposase n=1 Tax=Bradyrhizobium ottawaense TaxID=931866 RepID=UPI00383327CA